MSLRGHSHAWGLETCALIGPLWLWRDPEATVFLGYLRAEEMAQPVKKLLYKHEGLSSIPGTQRHRWMLGCCRQPFHPPSQRLILCSKIKTCSLSVCLCGSTHAILHEHLGILAESTLFLVSHISKLTIKKTIAGMGLGTRCGGLCLESQS